MSRRGLVLALIGSGAVVGLLIWLPARFFGALLPADLRCTELSGSLWAGQCHGLSIRGSRSGDLRWQIHRPQWQPFKANISVVWTVGVEAKVSAELHGRVTLQLTRVQLPLQSLRDAMPADVTLGPIAAVAGRLESRGLEIGLDERGRLASLRGTAELRNTRLLRYNAEIGDFAAEFSGVTGRIKDLGGPLMLAGEARLTEPGAYAAMLRVTPKAAGLLPALPPNAPIEISIDGRL
ncbi:MAG: type II secretion system protein N [Gammaproteobacteria bacterium]|nr:type II secretion system protein N [Gammaproteobacteria bacterium]